MTKPYNFKIILYSEITRDKNTTVSIKLPIQ